ncbi:hypothetical protein ACOQFT_14375 [Ruegeria sp. MALMAid1280]
MRVPVQVGVVDWNLPVLGAAKLIELMREQANAPRFVVYGQTTGEKPDPGDCLLLFVADDRRLGGRSDAILP